MTTHLLASILIGAGVLALSAFLYARERRIARRARAQQFRARVEGKLKKYRDVDVYGVGDAR